MNSLGLISECCELFMAVLFEWLRIFRQYGTACKNRLTSESKGNAKPAKLAGKWRNILKKNEFGDADNMQSAFRP